MSFVTVKSYHSAVSTPWFGLHGLMLVCALLNILAFLVLYFCQPETRGLTITELSKVFDGRKGVKKGEKEDDAEVRTSFV